MFKTIYAKPLMAIEGAHVRGKMEDSIFTLQTSVLFQFLTMTI